ncbi:MAG: hypothetical protein MK078_15480 [Crocinitomicaceae bacterium]|nr:hypothetical protein [Crocinitomicaceae bacterium]
MDIAGQNICENDLCCSWHLDDAAPEGGYWIFERVKLKSSVWLLYDEELDYSQSQDTPHLLIEYYQELMIVSN